MIRVEAVVIRDRVETVIDAVAREAEHVGVTVVDAVGQGFQHDTSHELPKALLTFIVPEHKAKKIAEAICGAARSGNEYGDGLVWLSPVYHVKHVRTGTPLHEHVETRVGTGVA